MAREAPRTLTSLLPPYQQGIGAADYELIVVDTGLTPSLPRVDGIKSGVRVKQVSLPRPASLAIAINAGLAAARGRAIGILLDGARLASPRLLSTALAGLALRPNGLVTPLGWHLGSDLQRHAIAAGYDARREDQQLASIEWQVDGYRLFELAAPDDASPPAWPGALDQSSFPVMSKARWEELGGADVRFDQPAGGHLGRDLYRRALALPGAELVVLLGEGTFHQLHGGVETSADDRSRRELRAGWDSQYLQIRGAPLMAAPAVPVLTIGQTPRPAGTAQAVRHPAGIGVGQIDEIVRVAEEEAAAGRPAAGAQVARLARQLAPDDPAPQRVLRQLGRWLPDASALVPPQRAAGLLATAEALRRAGLSDLAHHAYNDALAIEPNLPAAHVGLSTLRFPGPWYLDRIAEIHRLLHPAFYLEVGVAYGMSLAQVRSPTVAIGIDPAPRPQVNLQAETHIYNETSDAFFARAGSRAITGDRHVDLAFIDGLHLFEQALRDFINVERLCAPGSTIMIHDTLPLDEPTQRRSLDTGFHSGDVWKLIACLRHYRPDLSIINLPAAPTGLTLVRGLDPNSEVLSRCYDEAVARFIDTPFAEIGAALGDYFTLDERPLEIVLAGS